MHSRTAFAAAAILVLAGLPARAGTDAGTGKEYVPDVQMETLQKAPLPGSEGKEVIVVHITAPPGFVGERHLHPGPVYMYVLKGAVTLETDEGTTTASAGELVPEPINVAMTPRNASDTEPAEVLVFQIGSIGEPMMVKAE